MTGASAPAEPLLAALADGRAAIAAGGVTLPAAQLRGAVEAAAVALPRGARVAVLAEPVVETVVAVAACLVAGAIAVPLDPRAGESAVAHIVGDARPQLVLHRPGASLGAPLGGIPARAVDCGRSAPDSVVPVAPEEPALTVYTSGTTGRPKGAVLSRRALAANLDALADAWAWTAADTVVHALPLFHVHGLVLGSLGPLRIGGTSHRLDRFDAAAIGALARGGSAVVFAVPTLYHRLAEALRADPGAAAAVGRARLLVSGSAALPRGDADALAALTGLGVLERYGLTETLILTAQRVDVRPRPGSVGPPLPGVALRLRDGDGTLVAGRDAEAVGVIEARTPSLFAGYLGRPEATASAVAEGWFTTGDVGYLDAAGDLHLLGRDGLDIVKSGGYKIGAAEVEAELAAHPAVLEAAVAPEPDGDLGERVAAWVVVAPGAVVSAADLEAWVADRLAPHKRPRAVRFVAALPRTALGKVVKTALPRG